ncbi:hypothetical protein HYALB_00001188 [Hymenoscyphus albidus]|uniref:Uncharacterized protein n=1 Tax=Hymenoscyphus albidus TaxID=595503 RepID=A0A9N9Q2L3_9HELO|nr:hypothetical protein HYALB_00001188 [Hymenoscyphus albidus]
MSTRTRFYTLATLVLVDSTLSATGYHGTNAARWYLVHLAADSAWKYLIQFRQEHADHLDREEFEHNLTRLRQERQDRHDRQEDQRQEDEDFRKFEELFEAFPTDAERLELLKDLVGELEQVNPEADVKAEFLAELEKRKEENPEGGEPFAEEFFAWLRGETEDSVNAADDKEEEEDVISRDRTRYLKLQALVLIAEA